MDILKLISKARIYQCSKNLDLVCKKLASGLLKKEDHIQFMSELQSVLRHVLWQMENADTVSISQQSIKQTIEDDIEQQELSLDIESKLDD